MKKVLLLSMAFLVSFGILFLFKQKTQTNDISDLREKHANFIKNHPYSETLTLSKEERKEMGIPPNAYFEQEYLLEMNPRTGRTEPEKLYALQKELQNGAYQKNVPGTFDNSWEERGPRNVPGRTRALMFDPNDVANKRVIAGGVSGGLWKTDDIENASSLWQRIGIPENLSVSSITYDENDTQNMFVGTGESYVSGDVNGNGIWRSTDGGTTWEHVFGDANGTTYFSGDATITVNAPGSIAGEYVGIKATFGPQTTTAFTSDVVLVDDGSADPTLACNPLVNGAEVNGKIAVIQRGECTFVDKVMNAQNAGAIGVIMINSFAGTPIAMGGTSTTITIPSMMISRDDGDLILNELGSGNVNVTFDFDTDNNPAGVIVPGAFHVNDIRTRNNGGATEIFAAITDAYSQGAIMGAGTFGLYKSTDNGDSWTKLNLPLTPAGNDYMPNDIEIGADNKIWISTINSQSFSDGGGGVLVSDDGTNFILKYSVAGGADRTELAVSSADPDKIYLLAEHNAVPVVIFKTLNAFATNPANMPLPVDAGASIPANDFTRGQSFYDLMISVDPNNDEIVYVGGVDSFRSSDGGNNWSQMSKWTTGNGQPSNIPLVHADQHELVFHPTDSDKGIMATDGGVFYATSFASAISSNSAIGERKWDYNTTQFYKAGIGQDVSNERLLAGAQDNGSFLKSNAASGTNIFSEIRGGDGMLCFIDKDEQYVVVSNYNNYFYRYSITGSYQTALITESNGSFVNMAELDDNLDILYTNASTTTVERIARVLNANGTPVKSYITDVLLLGTPTALKVSPYTTASSTLFVGSSRGNLFRVDNANTTPVWTQITGIDFFGSVSAINFGANEDEILVTFHNYGVTNIWFTDDGGVTWQNKEGNFPDIPVKDILMNPLLNDEVIVASDLGVWYSPNFNDATPNWIQSQNGMQNVKVTSFDLRTADNKVVASTYGRGLFTGFFTNTPASIDESDEFSSAINVYPTLVTNGTVTVSATQKFDATSISIFNVQGKQVFSDKLNISQDEKTISFNLKSGIYFMNFSNSGLTTTKKIIVE